MPTTIAEILVLLVALLPGCVFAVVGERKRPTRKVSALREVGIYLVAAAVAYLSPLLLLSLGALLNSGVRSELRRVLLEPNAYTADHPLRVYAGVAAVVLAACVTAILLATNQRIAGWVEGDDGGSSWWTLFHRDVPSGEKVASRAQVHLDDGSIITGIVYS